MNLNLTLHANQRLRQRGITSKTLDVLSEYGEVEHWKGGLRIFLPQSKAEQVIKELQLVIKRKQDRKEIKEIRETINAIRRASGIAIIEIDGKVITVYHKYRHN